MISFKNSINMITKIAIGPAELSEQNIFILNNIDVLTGNLKFKEVSGARDKKYIIIVCKLQMTNRKLNKLKKTIKSLLQVDDVRCQVEPEEKY